MRIVVVALLLIVRIAAAGARDLGQWSKSDPEVVQWYQTLKQPDVPTASCCGEADGYWADEVHVRNGKTYATVTDDRPDAPLGRHHVPNGTEVEIPNNKIKWGPDDPDQTPSKNPTGHTVVFLSTTNYVYCYAPGGGI